MRRGLCGGRRIRAAHVPRENAPARLVERSAEHLGVELLALLRRGTSAQYQQQHATMSHKRHGNNKSGCKTR